jgi:hypothetical protein
LRIHPKFILHFSELYLIFLGIFESLSYFPEIFNSINENEKENCRTILGCYSAQGHMAPAWPAQQGHNVARALGVVTAHGARRWRN